MPSYRLAGNEICDFHFIREPFLFCARQCQVDHNYTDYKFILSGFWNLVKEQLKNVMPCIFLSLPHPFKYIHTHICITFMQTECITMYDAYTQYMCVCVRACAIFRLRIFLVRKMFPVKFPNFE